LAGRVTGPVRTGEEELAPTGIRSPDIEARHADNKIILTIIIFNKAKEKQRKSDHILFLADQRASMFWLH
jgi:hypothetical protein